MTFWKHSCRATAILVFLVFVSMGIGCQNEGQTEKYGRWPDNIDLGFIKNGSDLVCLDIDENLIGTVVASSSPSVPGDTWFNWAWSKDGKQIIYEDTGIIYVLTEDGKKEQIAEDAFAFKLSPDGKRLGCIEKVPIEELSVESRESEYRFETYFERLKIINIDSREIQVIEEGEIYSFDWTYDSEKLIYINNHTEHHQADGVYMQNILTGEERRLLDAAYYREISCSPNAPLFTVSKWDGHDIFHLYLCDYQDGNLKEIYDEHSSRGVVWFPSGEYLITISEKSTQEAGINDILIMDLDGNVMHSLSYNDSAFFKDEGRGTNGSPSVSPDEMRIAFQRSYDIKRGIEDIYIWDISKDRQNPDGSTEHHVERITFDGSNWMPQWRPE